MNERIYLSPPHMSGDELALVKDAFESNYITPLGPMVDVFEEAFAETVGIPHCVALTSGTAATHLALRHLGVGPGDTVLVSTLTFIGSVISALYCGATPVFIDSDPLTWNMDMALLAEEMDRSRRIGTFPKAIIPTDLYGQCADLDAAQDICSPHGIPVIADSAEALGASYKDRPAGSGAYAAVYSFNGNKIITTSGGGMLASEDVALIEHARKLAAQARDEAPWYEHSEVGYNYRMSNILAAIGLGQLKVLDERVRRKREIFDTYQEKLGDLPGITFMPEAPYGRGNRWLTVILVDESAFGHGTHAVRDALEAENIEARPLWKPMHRQPVFQGCRICRGEVADKLFEQGLCLPSGTAMTEVAVARVADVIRAVQC